MDKRGESTGMITNLVVGIAGLVIVIIIAFLIVSSLSGGNLLPVTTNTTTNETNGFINQTGYQLQGINEAGNPRGFNILSAINATGTLITSGNYTINSSGTVTNASSETWNDVVNFTYTFGVDGNSQSAVNRLESNFTSGVDNISSKLPTVLLIAAIVLILSILAVLIAVWRRMGMGGGSL